MIIPRYFRSKRTKTGFQLTSRWTRFPSGCVSVSVLHDRHGDTDIGQGCIITLIWLGPTFRIDQPCI